MPQDDALNFSDHLGHLVARRLIVDQAVNFSDAIHRTSRLQGVGGGCRTPLDASAASLVMTYTQIIGGVRRCQSPAVRQPVAHLYRIDVSIRSCHFQRRGRLLDFAGLRPLASGNQRR